VVVSRDTLPADASAVRLPATQTLWPTGARLQRQQVIKIVNSRDAHNIEYGGDGKIGCSATKNLLQLIT